jgi:hypothetical protein
MRGQNALGSPAGWYWIYRSAICPGPGCREVTIEVAQQNQENFREAWRQVFPIGANRGPVPSDVPTDVAQDYIEACNVLPISAKASAALSRRRLQNMLHTNGYKAKDLAEEIDLLLNEPDPKKALPHKLRQTVDAIRNFAIFRLIRSTTKQPFKSSRWNLTRPNGVS